MPKQNRSKKQAARKKQRTTGAPYTAAAAGTGHQHPAPDFGVMDSCPYGVTRQVNLAPAAALVGAARAGCQPCQKSAIPAVLAGDRLVLAVLAGTPFSLLPSTGLMSPASARLWEVGRRMRESGFEGPAPAAPMLALLESLPEEELRDVLEDALDMWAGFGAGPEEFAAPPADERAERDTDEDDLPEVTAPPENPFTGEGLVYLSADQLAAGIPLPMLLQSALAGTVEDQITEHAHDLFDTLDERGPAAIREAVLLLAQYLLSGGTYGAGSEASVRYYRQQQPSLDVRTPARTVLHLLLATYIGTGRPGAEYFLDGDEVDAELGGVLRMLFCIAAFASGWPADRQQALTEELCADVR
ncbi:hypothetical protein [Streptomyces sp. NRRL S-350]|uniref:hypothetical protein n=1 Tax=Streptomyces sp. NRRL S-350 TaxID=1463902 RepID=UPI0004BF6A65|nr:hypothetical protein [Streptomyces sp. NRRL S-350]